MTKQYSDLHPNSKIIKEDDERFEEFIKRLKTSLCLGDWDVAGKDDCVMCKTVDKIAEELNGENKK